MPSSTFRCRLLLSALGVWLMYLNAAQGHLLKAAAQVSDIVTRSDKLPLRQQLELHYIDGGSINSHELMAARLEIASSVHSLLLEEIEHLLEEVYCGPDGKVEIRFLEEHFSSARESIESHEDLLLITSHHGCNDEGERIPYRILDRRYNARTSTMLFSLRPASWKEDYDLKVKFGPEKRIKYRMNLHEKLRRRNILRDLADSSTSSTLPSVSSVPVSSTSIVPTQSEIMFPTLSVTGKVEATGVVDDVSSSLQNTQILPPSFDNITIGIPFHDTGLGINCINCSTAGTVGLTSGYFSVGKSGDLYFLDDGFLELAANNFAAHIELDMTWAAGFGESVPISLGKIPLTPFSIPGVANVGATFTPHLIISAAVAVDLSFKYGFEVTVPNNSTAVAAFGQVSNSSINGFGAAHVTALPFTSEVSDIKLTLSATLQPEIAFGVILLNETAGAAVFLNLPQVSVSVSPVVSTNDMCEPSTNATDVQDISSLIGNLTHVVPKVEVAAGFVVQANHIGQTAWTPLATTFMLETACYAYKTAGSTYVPATVAFASATASKASAAQASATSSVAVNLRLCLDDSWKSRTSWRYILLALTTLCLGSPGL